ncbi:sugar ABC transporter ATP-binding protein [Ahrensia kielensis]|uniref:sugar ABC transporter ATP-binding protein n=1 Tax=Ahrensia kielensis TaxID=76980 RepID=UPI00036FBC00|nr:sugar ABC transporter ATP-binding protein [Ahrensia kielensis]
MSKILEIKGVSKQFPGVLALDNIDFDLDEGEVHALLGENGAGKSTLVKIITGAYHRDSGIMTIGGKAVDFQTPAEAKSQGIGGIYQEFSQVNSLSVAENIFLGDYPMKGLFIDWETMNATADELLTRFGVDASATDKLSSLGVATRQMVEILKVVHRENLRILIMDEPTSALSDSETHLLFDFVRTIQATGVAIIYISHRLDEIKQICDRITVFKNGKKMSTNQAQDMSIDAIVTEMVGTELKDHFPPKNISIGDPCIEVCNLSGAGFEDISFTAHKGEVLGITGLVGAGKTEVLISVFGGAPIKSGEIKLNGTVVNIHSPIEAVKNRIGLLPESRKEQGLNLIMSCLENISLASLDKISKPFLDLKLEKEFAEQNFSKLEIRPSNPKNLAENLSGGNQQKVVLSKWLLRDSEVLMFDEPTRGIDVGAKFQIYSLIMELAKAGKTIIVASSEIDEVVGICNRVLVMRRGALVSELSGESLKTEQIVLSMSGETLVS